MKVDPSLIKLWTAWTKWLDDVPLWDPWGAAGSLILIGFILGFILWRNITDS